MGEALDAPVLVEAAVDGRAGLLLDGVGERQVRDVAEEGFVEREACARRESARHRSSGGRVGGRAGDVHAVRCAEIWWNGMAAVSVSVSRRRECGLCPRAEAG